MATSAMRRRRPCAKNTSSTSDCRSRGGRSSALRSSAEPNGLARRPHLRGAVPLPEAAHLRAIPEVTHVAPPAGVIVAPVDEETLARRLADLPDVREHIRSPEFIGSVLFQH